MVYPSYKNNWTKFPKEITKEREKENNKKIENKKQ